MNAKKSFFGSFIALVIGSSCCWLSSLAVWVGGATIMTTIMALQSKTQIYFIILAVVLLAWGIFLVFRSKGYFSSKKQ